MHSIQAGWLWIGFIALVAVVFAIDLIFLGGGRARKVTARQALMWTLVWVSCALLFNFGLWCYLSATHSPSIAHQKALEFFTGYLIEESLSFDNMFVILMIFKFFSVPFEFQRRVLIFGVLGAIVMRFAVIYLGTWLVGEYYWILYLFGAFLVWAGAKIFFHPDEEKDLTQNIFYRWVQKHLRLTEKFHGEKFFVRHNLFWYATPLFLVLVLIEMSDLIFAFDSIPAIFSITLDPFIVFTSNIFAILGLRAIYFLLANLASRFKLLKYGVGLVLVFVGAKMLLSHWIEIPVVFALSVVASILLTTIILSFVRRKD